MALQKTKQLDSGIEVTYHKVSSLQLEGVAICVVYVQSFKDQQARLDNKQAVEMKQFIFQGADNPCQIEDMNPLNVNPYILVYEKLKTLPEFSGAVDV